MIVEVKLVSLFFAPVLFGVLAVAQAAEEGRIVRKGGLVVDAPVSMAFPLFTPEGELNWADGWEYRVIYPSKPAEACKEAAMRAGGCGSFRLHPD